MIMENASLAQLLQAHLCLLNSRAAHLAEWLLRSSVTSRLSCILSAAFEPRVWRGGVVNPWLKHLYSQESLELFT